MGFKFYFIVYNFVCVYFIFYICEKLFKKELAFKNYQKQKDKYLIISEKWEEYFKELLK